MDNSSTANVRTIVPTAARYVALALVTTLLLSTCLWAAKPDPILSFAVSRFRNHIRCVVSEPGVYVIQADRDIAGVRIQLEPDAGEPNAGRWNARLTPLPDTEEEELPNLASADSIKPIWRVDRTVTRSDPPKIDLQAQVPRKTFRNWGLTVGRTTDGDKTLQIRIDATPIDEVVRARQLMSMRAKYDPLVQKDDVREVIRHLTDDEVRYWTGFRSRSVFLTVWSRLRVDELMSRYPGVDAVDLLNMGHELPNGLELHTFTPRAM
jgi:hypothetical protein